MQYEGGYTDYIEARQRNAASGAATAGPVDAPEEKKSSRDWKQNSPVKLKFSYKEQKEYETIDETIAALEEKIESLEDEVLKNATNSAKLNELLEKKELAEKELEEKMERWVYLNDLAEKIEAQKTGGN